jgi:hypothetical protein
MSDPGLGRLLGALLTLLLPACAQAHLPELFGRDYVLAPVGQAAAPAPVSGSSPADIARLEAAVTRLRDSHGPYDAAITDPLTQLATLRARGRNPVAALRDLEEAIHLLRVNNGLLHPVQLPLLRQLSEVYARIGDVSSSVLALRYGYRIHGMGDRPLDDEGLADSLAYFRAVRNRFIDPVNPISDTLFVQGYDDNESLYQRLRDDGSVDPEVLRAVALSQLHNLYILLGTDLTQAEGIFVGNDARRERLITMQNLALGKGLEIVDVLMEATDEGDAMLRAQLILERANWLQWNGKWRRARNEYRALMAELPDSPEGAALRERLASPAVLPEDSALWDYLQRPEIPVRLVANASFRVSARGEAKRVEIEAIDETQQDMGALLRRMLKDSHFRPALAPDGPTDAFASPQRYLVID